MGDDYNEGDAAPVTPEWKARVRTHLENAGRGAHTRLARDAGCSTGQLTELLKDSTRYSRLVPLVDRALGWATPRRETSMIRFLVDRATEEQRAYLLDAARMITRAPDAEATRALVSMLKVFRTNFDPRRDLRAIVNVLLIDSDDSHARAVHRDAAIDDRIELLTTDNAIDGMLLVGATKPHLVIIDAELDGMAACRRIKNTDNTSQIAVVVMAKHVTHRLREEGRDAKAMRVVPRPIELAALVSDLLIK